MMRFLAIVTFTTCVFTNAETSSLRGSGLEDMEFWERELGGSHRRNLVETVDEDFGFWERELGGSHRRRAQEDTLFWERELGGSHRRALADGDLNFDNQDVEFWGRELGGSHR
mmetsp:Transcript_52107/g.62707  ORF Transcript_52107/g.62707 Transcript_52107/m.62707 type:complete len:113 (-) Transcript_52107:351-689(-)